MELSLDRTASDTIELLEARLQRIEYVITGRSKDGTFRDGGKSITTKLQDLEHSLDRLVAKSRVMQDLLKLQARHPDFFHSTKPGVLPSSLDTANKLSIVLAAASTYSQTASCLTAVKDTSLPRTESSTQLINTGTQAAEVELVQQNQQREIAALKQRSAAVLQRWYTVDILQTGEYWADLETRVERVEQTVRRTTSRQQVEDGI